MDPLYWAGSIGVTIIFGFLFRDYWILADLDIRTHFNICRLHLSRQISNISRNTRCPYISPQPPSNAT